MPTLDSLPDELLQEILNYVMIRDNPFNIGDCIRTAKVAADCLQAQEAGSSTQPEPVPTVDLPPQTILPPSHFGGEEQRESLIKEDLERKRKRDKFAKNKSQWPIYDFSLAVHQPHLLDWRVASSVCNRFRSLGKEAFFSISIRNGPHDCREAPEPRFTEPQLQGSENCRQIHQIHDSGRERSLFP